MRTKIVYCIVSNDKDIYLEQAWVSIYTLRLYNPDAEVILLVDKGTEATLTGKRAGIRELVTEVVAVDTPDGYNAMQRSRYLKTNFRQFIAGDLLFIDSDTVIGGSLAAIDDIEAEIACVPDAHEALSEYSQLDGLKMKIQSLFGMDMDDAKYYYNSGVVYVKDTKRTRDFFVDWYNQWKYSAFEKGCNFDQPALYAVDMKRGFIIKELSGVFNCQIYFSLKYLYSGVILHFFNIKSQMISSELSVFYDKKFYMKLKEYGAVVNEIKEVLDDKARWFNLQTNIINSSRFDFLCNYVGDYIYKSYMKQSFLYKLNERLCSYKFMIGNFRRLLRLKLGKR